MSSRSTVRKLKIASRPAAKQAKSHKLARIAKFPKVGKHAQKAVAPAKKAPARSAPPSARSAPPPARSAPPPAPAPAKKASHVPALTPAKQVQQPKQSLARSFYWSELRVGDDLPPLTKPAIDRVQIVRYAAASGDFNRLHLDEPFAHALGFPGLFAPGMLAMGFIGQLLTAWLRRGHVRRLAARFVKMSAQAFEEQYVYRTTHQMRFRKPPDKQCPFLENHGCSIHPAKPTQCRTFPFWPDLVEHRAAWNRTAQYCPGIGKGPLIQIGTAMELAEEQRQAYPNDY